MSSEAVKKRGRPKKVVEVVVVVSAEPSVESAAGKKTKSRKAIVKVGEEGAVAKTVTRVIGKKGKEEEVGTSKKTASSKRPSAKKPEIAVEASASPAESSQRQSIILEQAQAFSKSLKAVPDEVTQLATSQISQETKIDVEAALNQRPEESIESAKPELIFAASRPSNQYPPPTSPQHNAPITSPMPQSSFLNSFLNDPEPAPVPPPDSGRRLDDSSIDEPTEPQANADMISTPASQQPKQVPNQVPKQPSSSAMPPGYTITESMPQLRAFTTTSFKALKANSPPSRPMFAATSFAAMKSGDVKSASTSTKSSPKPSKPPISPTSSPSKPTIKPSPSPSSRPPPQSTPLSTSTITRPNPHSRPPTRTALPPHSQTTQPPSQPQLQPKPSPLRRPAIPTRLLRPTEMPLDELLKNPEFRSKRRQWVSFIVSAPIAIGMSYELYRRYKIESAKRVEMGMRMTDGPTVMTTTSAGAIGEEGKGAG